MMIFGPTPLQSRRAFLRRTFLAATASALAPVSARAADAEAGDGKIMTVLGLISPREFGTALTHEHMVVDFLGAEKAKSPRYDRAEALTAILPHLKRLKELGCQSLVECTPAYIGRDVRFLRQLAEASGLNILTNTGYYGAAENKFLPRHAFLESASELTRRWLQEWRRGIDGSGIRPGFIKLGVGSGKLTDLHAKLVRAAARVHLESGLTIAIHTGNGEAALDELRILEQEGVAPAALIWVHAQNDPDRHVEVARRGAWVSLDGYTATAEMRERYRGFLTRLRRETLLGRVLLSHDHFWSVEGEGEHGTLRLANGAPKPFQDIFTHLLPNLRENGFDDREIHQLTVGNPAGAFTLRKRVQEL